MPSGFYRKLFNILFFSFFKPIHPFSPQKQIQENAGTDAPGQRVGPEYHTDIRNKMNTDGNITYPEQTPDAKHDDHRNRCIAGSILECFSIVVENLPPNISTSPQFFALFRFSLAVRRLFRALFPAVEDKTLPSAF